MSNPPLHAFMSQNRSRILAMCLEKIKESFAEASDEELLRGLEGVLEEIIRALRRDAGLPAESPLPERSPSAVKHGGLRQYRGDAVERIARDFGSISQSVGELGARQGLRFAASEYQIFNECIDEAIASALEQFSSQDQRKQEAETAQRVGFIAHELRNALSSARMAFDMLRRGQVGVQSKTGDVLGRGLVRLESLINQMLLATQLQAGIKPAPKRMQLLDLLLRVEELTVPERNIHLSVEVDEGVEVDADERLLVSALGNLLQNAFKFTRPGGQIILRGRRKAAAVYIEVEDECGGLPPGKQEELFAPYVQRGTDRRGLGLGLAITRDAVQAHGGELLVRNLPRKGCVFTVKLPAPL